MTTNETEMIDLSEFIRPDAELQPEPDWTTGLPPDVSAGALASFQWRRDDAEGKHLWEQYLRQNDTGYRPIVDRLITREQALSQPPAAPLIGNLLYRNTIATVYGREGTYKSFMLAGLAVAVAAGKSWGPHEVPEALPVLYIAAEGGSGIPWRIEAACQHQGVDPEQLWETNLSVMPSNFQLGNSRDMEGLAEIVRDRGIQLLIIDTKRRVSDGFDENSNSDQSVAYNLLDRLREDFGTTIVMVHHSTKTGDSASGAQAWLGNPWTVAKITANTDNLTCIYEVEKHKDAPTLPYAFQLSPTHVDGHNKPILVAEPTDVREVKKAAATVPQPTAAEFVILESLANVDPATTAQLAERLGKSQSTVRDHTGGLRKKGLIHQTTDGVYYASDAGRSVIPEKVDNEYASTAAKQKKGTVPTRDQLVKDLREWLLAQPRNAKGEPPGNRVALQDWKSGDPNRHLPDNAVREVVKQVKEQVKEAQS